MLAMWTEASSILHEHPSFRVPPRTPARGSRAAKSASMKMKLGIIVDLMLLKKQIKSESMSMTWTEMS